MALTIDMDPSLPLPATNIITSTIAAAAAAAAFTAFTAITAFTAFTATMPRARSILRRHALPWFGHSIEHAIDFSVQKMSPHSRLASQAQGLGCG